MSSLKKPDKQAFQVAPSPFNAVKLELAIILLVALLLWIVVDSITSNELTQVSILFVFSLLGAAWLIYRTRTLTRRVSNQTHNNDGDSG